MPIEPETLQALLNQHHFVCTTLWRVHHQWKTYAGELPDAMDVNKMALQLIFIMTYETISTLAVVVDLGFTTLLTFQVISIAFYSERKKSDKFCSEALISAWGSFTCRKSTTRNPWLYFLSEGSHTQDCYALKKIHWLRLGLNLRTSDAVASMITKTENYMPSGVLQFMLWPWEQTIDVQINLQTNLNVLFPGKTHVNYPIPFQTSIY